MFKRTQKIYTILGFIWLVGAVFSLLVNQNLMVAWSCMIIANILFCSTRIINAIGAASFKGQQQERITSSLEYLLLEREKKLCIARNAISESLIYVGNVGNADTDHQDEIFRILKEAYMETSILRDDDYAHNKRVLDGDQQ